MKKLKAIINVLVITVQIAAIFFALGVLIGSTAAHGLFNQKSLQRNEQSTDRQIGELQEQLKSQMEDAKIRTEELRILATSLNAHLIDAATKYATTVQQLAGLREKVDDIMWMIRAITLLAVGQIVGFAWPWAQKALLAHAKQGKHGG